MPQADIDTSRRPRRAGRAVAAVALAAVALVISTTAASADGKGASTETFHARGADTDGLIVLDFVPGNGAPPLPAGCWANPTLAIVSTGGNAVEHNTVNKSGDFWFTSTYAGDATVYPVPQPPVIDNNGDVVVDRSHPIYSGHLTTWYGEEDNKQNGSFHATASFHGTGVADPSQSVSLNAHIQYATNANGVNTVNNASASC